MNNSLSLDRTRSQWVDLGYNTNVCIALPEICGAAGGAISLWMKMMDCSGYQGIISTHNSARTGLILFCNGDNLQYDPFT